MKILGRKSLASIMFVLVVASLAFVRFVPTVKAASYATAAFLTSSPPDSVGVGQQIKLVMWITPGPPAPNVYHAFRINITYPNQTVQTFGPFTSDSTGSSSFVFTPTSVGYFSALFFYPGETFNNTGDHYNASVSSIMRFYIQSAPVTIVFPNASVTVSPNPVGVGQQVEIGLSISPPPPSSIDVFHGIQVVIRKPNDSVDVRGPYNSSLNGNYSFRYVVTQNGTHSVYLNYFGEWFTSGNGIYYNPTTSPQTNFIAQTASVKVQLVVNVSGSGTTNPPAGIQLYNPGDVANITAQANSGWRFDRWLLNGVNVSTSQLYSVPMFSNKSLIAVFTQLPVCALNVSISGLGSTTPAAGVTTYPRGTTVNATATPASGWRFDYWRINGTNTYVNATYSFVINGNSTLTAVFAQLSYNLILSVTGSGSTNPPTGTFSYLSGTIVNVTATPALGWSFSNWLRNASNVGTNPSYSFTMNSNYTLTGVFAENPPPPPPPQQSFSLTIGITGSGSTNPAAGIQSYLQGTQVSISAIPSSGWKFTNWILDGLNVSTAPNYSVLMNAAHTLTAIFTQTLPPSGNDPPVAAIVTIASSSAPARAIEGEPVTFKGNGTDSDGFIVAYRWTSSLDGLLSSSPEFSTSTLSVGTHTIYLEVQDNLGAWSTMTSQTLVVVGEFPLSIVLAVTVTGFAGSAGASAFIHFHGRLQSSLKIKNKLQRKLQEESEKQQEEDEEEKREKEKGKPYLKLEADFPSRIMEATPYEPKLKVTNTGQRQAEKIQVTSICTPGLVLCTTTAEIDALPSGESKQLTFPMATSEDIRKGIYNNRFEAKCEGALDRVRTCHTRAVKIGVLSSTTSSESSKRLKDWLRRESYVFSELDNADSLMGGLLDYDLLVLGPDVELPRKWVQNISSFVRNGQSLCVIDRIITEEQNLLAKILGYSDMLFEPIKCDQSIIKICDNEDFVLDEYASGEEIRIGKIWGNPCVSTLYTGKALAGYVNLPNGTQTNATANIPAMTTNKHGKGKVFHFNFHVEDSADSLSTILRQTFNWLLS